MTDKSPESVDFYNYSQKRVKNDNFLVEVISLRFVNNI